MYRVLLAEMQRSFRGNKTWAGIALHRGGVLAGGGGERKVYANGHTMRAARVAAGRFAWTGPSEGGGRCLLRDYVG